MSSSPPPIESGFSAANCTVSIVDLNTNLLVHVVNLHKKEDGIDNVSGRMEKEGVRRGLLNLKAQLYTIRSICTDNDAKIGKMMREDEAFRSIKHLLDFWHLIKALNHDLRELTKKKFCSNISFWRRKIIDHAYFVHFKYGKNRARGLIYWKSTLAHVTGRHAHLDKVPFLAGIKRCKHAKLGQGRTHLIDRKSKEFQALKAIILKPTFCSGFLRASPKKNTSPNECYNSVINLYAPKRLACSPGMYAERVKLATLHFNTLALLSMLGLREERWNASVNVRGTDAKRIKRREKKVEHAWRREVWEVIPEVIEERKMQQFLQKHAAPSDFALAAALVSEDEEGEERGSDDGGESDVSVELGGGVYGEEGDSDREPSMKVIEMSDAEDEASTEEEEGKGEAEGEGEGEDSDGSLWDEGLQLVHEELQAGQEGMQVSGRGRGSAARGRGGRGSRGGRGRGRGAPRGGRGRGRGRGGMVATPVAAVLPVTVPTAGVHPTGEEEEVVKRERRARKGDGEKKDGEKTKRKAPGGKKKKKEEESDGDDEEDGGSDSDYEPIPTKKRKAKAKGKRVR